MNLRRTTGALDDSTLLGLRSFELLAPYAAQHGYDATDRRVIAPYSKHGAGYRGTEKVMPASWVWGIAPGIREAKPSPDLLEVRLDEGDGFVWPVVIHGRGVFEDTNLLIDVYQRFSESVHPHLIR